MAGMRGGLWQAADRLYQFFPPQLTSFRDGSSPYQLSQQRGTGHGGNTSLGKKSYLLDAVISQTQSEFQYVAASGILDLRGGVRFFHFASVARMLEVIEDLG